MLIVIIIYLQLLLIKNMHCKFNQTELNYFQLLLLKLFVEIKRNMIKVVVILMNLIKLVKNISRNINLSYVKLSVSSQF
jgi:hypothetical protein